MIILNEIRKAYKCSIMNRNLFKETILNLFISEIKDGTNTTYFFEDGSTLDTDSLNPFELTYATFVSADLSLVEELKKL